MRSVLLAVVALAACTQAPDVLPPAERATSTPSSEGPLERPPMIGRTFSEPIGDAESGLDLSDTRLFVDEDGILAIDVAIPGTMRSPPSDSVQIYLDVDRDHENSGYDVRFVVLGESASVERWDGVRWRNRTPRSFTASYSSGVHIRVRAVDVGIASSAPFDLFVASVDEITGKVTDLAPDGAFWERWTYER